MLLSSQRRRVATGQENWGQENKKCSIPIFLSALFLSGFGHQNRKQAMLFTRAEEHRQPNRR